MSCRDFVRVLLGIVFTVAIADCDDGMDIVEVSGTLTRNGKAVPNLEIYFVPTQGRSSVGMSDENGRFNMRYLEGVDGAEIGHHSVFVAYNPPAETGYPQPPDMDEIRNKYGSQEVSPIKIEITKPRNDLEIKLD